MYCGVCVMLLIVGNSKGLPLSENRPSLEQLLTQYYGPPPNDHKSSVTVKPGAVQKNTDDILVEKRKPQLIKSKNELLSVIYDKPITNQDSKNQQNNSNINKEIDETALKNIWPDEIPLPPEPSLPPEIDETALKNIWPDVMPLLQEPSLPPEIDETALKNIWPDVIPPQPKPPNVAPPEIDINALKDIWSNVSPSQPEPQDLAPQGEFIEPPLFSQEHMDLAENNTEYNDTNNWHKNEGHNVDAAQIPQKHMNSREDDRENNPKNWHNYGGSYDVPPPPPQDDEEYPDPEYYQKQSYYGPTVPSPHDEEYTAPENYPKHSYYEPIAPHLQAEEYSSPENYPRRKNTDSYYGPTVPPPHYEEYPASENYPKHSYYGPIAPHLQDEEYSAPENYPRHKNTDSFNEPTVPHPYDEEYHTSENYRRHPYYGPPVLRPQDENYSDPENYPTSKNTDLYFDPPLPPPRYKENPAPAISPLITTTGTTPANGRKQLKSPGNQNNLSEKQQASNASCKRVLSTFLILIAISIHAFC